MAHRKLGKYEVAERLGRGGMAEVYRAYHANLDRYVAIKLMHAFLADDPEFKNRFEKEARNIARLRHNNIVQVYDFEYDDESESYYMVMELVQGPTLKERLFRLNEQGKLLSLASVVQVIKQAAAALAYAHSQNMVHRDVKPGNLMLDRDERVVLTDFGIAKIVTGAQFTSTGGMVGTPAYMAPEQGLGEPGDERADLYSLGVIFFQLVTGRLPYDAETPLAVILKHLNEPVPSARDYRPELPEHLDAIIMKLMAKDPNHRFQSANELIAELELLEHEIDLSAPEFNQVPNEALQLRDRTMATPSRLMTPAMRATQPVTSTGSATPATPAAPPPSRSGGWTWLLGGAAILLVAIGLYALAANQGLVPAIGLLPTHTPTDLATPTTTPGATTVALAASTDEPTPVPTDTSTPTDEPTALPSATPTDTETPTSEPTFTNTPTDTATPTATSTPTRQPSRTPTDTPTASATATPSATSTDRPTATGTPSATPTDRPTATPTATVTPSQTPTATAAPTRTSAPSPTPRPTQTPTRTPTATATPTAPGESLALLSVTQTLVHATLAVENRQATLSACEFDYRIVDQVPADGDLFPVNSTYVREITFRNTGTCTWERNTSLNYVSGESFSAAPRIFIREAVPVGRDYVLRFEGRTPTRSGRLTGRWELRTPELIPIGEPMDISVFAFAR